MTAMASKTRQESGWCVRKALENLASLCYNLAQQDTIIAAEFAKVMRGTFPRHLETD